MSSPTLPSPLSLAGILLLADLPFLNSYTATKGTVRFLDALILSPGLHTQQKASEINKAEFPACAALTTGYAFRIENEATVAFLQRVGRTGCLTTIAVQAAARTGSAGRETNDVVAEAAYDLAVLTGILGIALTLSIHDLLAFSTLLLLVLARALHILILLRRIAAGASWHGAAEPGVQGDLLVLLSQDRWVRLRGQVDDLKPVTSGVWMRDLSEGEHGVVCVATVCVYAAVVVFGNCSFLGQVVLLSIWIVAGGCLGVANWCMRGLTMRGRELRVVGCKRFARRRDLADDLIEETGRDDWAVRLGMIVKENAEGEGLKIM